MTTLIGSLDYGATASDSDDFDISGYDLIRVVFRGLTIPGTFGVRLSDDDGVSFHETNGDYYSFIINNTTNATSGLLMRITEGSVTGAAGMFELLASKAHEAYLDGYSNRAVSATAGGVIFGHTQGLTGPFTHMRLWSSSGNITAGKLYVYGL